MKPLRKVTDALLGFDRRERRGTYVLSALLIVLLAVRFTAYRPGSVPDDPGSVSVAADSNQVIPGVSQPGRVPFTFDPNSASYEELLTLGLTERQATTLINYRIAGAQFRKPQELSRVYGIDSATAARLIPFIIIEESAGTPGSAQEQTHSYKTVLPAGREIQGTSVHYPAASHATAALPVDLNRSSAAELESLPGIGPVLAARIIKYRSLLGGFVDSRQLAEVYGLDSAVVSLVGPMVTVTHDSVSPLVLDSASFGDLARHPYVGYETARLITRYRELSGAPLTLGSMVSQKVITELQAERMAPYVRPSPGVTGTDYEFISSKVLK
ncbi:MAG: helix-hairpin-helix domain-containing protein [Bacteroidales bacterium]